MRAALLGVLAVLAFVLAGCGHSSTATDRRDAVNTYFDQVDKAEQHLLASQGEIDLTFGHYSLTHVTPSERRQLASAETAIGSALHALRAITPPPDASRVHGDLLKLTALQYHVAHELSWTADYLPRFSHALSPIPTAGAALGHDIASAGDTPIKPAQSPTGGPGAAAWAAAGCGGCHTLAATGSSGTAGPNLDQLHPTAAQVAAQVRSGGPGMPSFARRLSPAQIDALASFVGSSEIVPPSTAAVLNAYGAAFTAYGAALGRVLADLNRLDPPPVLRPTLEAERRLLAKSTALCTAIAAQLAKQQVDAANANIKELFLAVATGVTTGKDRRSANEAVRAYNAQLARIAKLSSAIAADRTKLTQKLG
jgi:mono/diheme cytochrome c family protein